MQISYYNRVLTAAIFASNAFCLPITTTSMYERSQNVERQTDPDSTSPVVNFADEVFDISNISVFGDVNDGSTNCTAGATTEDSAGENNTGTNTGTASGVNFGDEVFDVSGISVFGDVNDVGCD